MAVVEQCRKQIVQSQGIALLVSFLHARPPSLTNPKKLSSSKSRRKNGYHGSKETKEHIAVACERVQQKAAIALARLIRDQESAIAIMELQGEFLYGHLPDEPGRDDVCCIQHKFTTTSKIDLTAMHTCMHVSVLIVPFCTHISV